MNRTRHLATLTVVAATLLSFSVFSFADNTKKAAPKAAAPAKPAAGAKAATPGGAGAKPGAAGATTHSGPTTSSPHGPTTTTAGHGATTTTAHTTAAAGAHPNTASAPGHPGGNPAARPGVPGVKSGNLVHGGPVGSHDHIAANGSAMRTRANGRPADIHDARSGMDIHHNLAGGRAVRMERADHSRLYYEHGRPGYIAHPYGFHGHDYYRRSYYYNGRAYNRFYNHYGYHGVYLDVYAPAYYYAPGFYGWAYNPWVTPVPYAWGFAAAPWYGFYGAYFTPYPVYAGPNLWLTDYLISTTLAAAYEARQAEAAQAQAQAADAAAAPPAPLSPETKALIANEVKGQIALENAEAQANAQHQDNDAASSSIARILSDGQPHVFVAGKEIDVTDTAGQECAVSDGDVLQLVQPPAANETTATLTVLSSKGGVECRAQDSVAVSVDDLQEMHNHMRETLDQGLQELQAKQGKGGLPPAPASATAPPVTSAVAENAPPPDPAGAKELTQQAQASETTEKQVIAETASASAPGEPPPPPPPPPTSTATIALGQSMDDVTASMGQPTTILKLPTKTVYVYKDMKITFKAGKVADVE
jgi:hypothetical protein